MKEYKGISTVNIREYLVHDKDTEIGEEALKQILSDFSCPLNQDVEKFLKEQAIEFAKKNQSVTYLVISDEDVELLGYFTITIKPIMVKAESFSNTVRRKISRVSEFDGASGTYNLSAYLIAQLGKNYSNNINEKLAGKQLLDLAIAQVQELQYMAGGMVVFLEAEEREKLVKFYKDENGFRQFNIRKTEADEHTLVQMLKVL